ncbi:MAG: hypothetical protein DHS80DRAFT_22738 [Piptocephalis tieghemiana]|nr:MAG: hypothetical protein DHS80DRAFT_22738 [Piptocephalis tieghemiana]
MTLHRLSTFLALGFLTLTTALGQSTYPDLECPQRGDQLVSAITDQAISRTLDDHRAVLSLESLDRKDLTPFYLIEPLHPTGLTIVVVEGKDTCSPWCLARGPHEASSNSSTNGPPQPTFMAIDCERPSKNVTITWEVRPARTNNNRTRGWSLKASGAEDCLAPNTQFGQEATLVELPCNDEKAVWITSSSHKPLTERS